MNSQSPFAELTWNPTQPKQRVRLIDNPGKEGLTTGRTRGTGHQLMVQVEFGTAALSYHYADQLEPCPETEDLFELLQQARFEGPADLRRRFTFEKLDGHLTNCFFSMESSSTEFFPHQFKPVLKFLESPVGRLLIADEVGLGKTMESMFIWKELQARAEARRLLIVCPAMLQEKWRTDLLVRFGMEGEIVKADRILEKLEGFTTHGTPHSFSLITSLEGMRPPSDYLERQDTRSALARLLDRASVSGEEKPFDLVIIDEAHYLRNASTANHKLGELLRDAARHLVLLTATPIQIDSQNLYQLLKLLSPEDFYDIILFKEMMSANEPIVHALRSLLQRPPNLAGAQNEVRKARQNRYFSKHPVLTRVQEQLTLLQPTNREGLVRIAQLLENCSLLGQFMTRSRKRDVLPNRVIREPITLKIKFSDDEQQVYQRLSQRIRQQTQGLQGISFFSLVAKQRQMASSLVAALTGWQQKELLDELLWEDLGTIPSTSDTPHEDGMSLLKEQEVDLNRLEELDTKYNALVTWLKPHLQGHPHERVVIFAFFRETLKYLQRRLRQDGILTTLIMGDMGAEKWDIIRQFRREDGPNVLLSSEVGSEGIDLQFCRILINYDLPWNPMRVEQRIGRLDRLGQTSEKIVIVNLSLQDTIEERILQRLYERIGIFQQSIGDMEEILGQVTEQLLEDLFRRELNDVERERQAEERLRALEQNRLEQARLEDEAVHLLAFSGYILDAVDNSRKQGRYVLPDEIHRFVTDFFERQYPGTWLRASKTPGAFELSLSPEARVAFERFLSGHRSVTQTRLHQSNAPVLCIFSPKLAQRLDGPHERLEPTHPLLLWIRAQYGEGTSRFHPAIAVELKTADKGFLPKHYAFMAHRWKFEGLRTEHQLVYQVYDLELQKLLSPDESEALVHKAGMEGELFVNAAQRIPDHSALLQAIGLADDELFSRFDQASSEFKAENASRCEIQEKNASSYFERKASELRSRLERYRALGQTRVIPPTEGLLRAAEKELQVKREKIRLREKIEISCEQLVAGVICMSHDNHREVR